ncbi:MAG TPA: PAS domain-containing protein [Myxococcota bacterium]|nr:PAS domain-containing protein [Myxococcota bacterium]
MDQDSPGDRADPAQSLHGSEEILALALSVGRVGVWELDVETNRIRWSSEAGRLSEWRASPQEGGWADLLELVHPDDRAKVRTALAGAFAGETSRGDYEIETRFANPGEAMRWFHVKGRVLRDAAERPARMIGVVMDVTERKQVELALLASEGRLRKSQALAHLGAYELHVPSTVPDYWSEETYRILGRDPASGPIPFERVLEEIVHPDDRALATDTIGAAVTELRPWDVPLRLVRPDGTTRRTRSVGEPRRDDAGLVVTLVGTLLDLTELRSLEDQVVQLQKLEAVGRLAGGVSHDFNNLLTVIATYCDLALARLEPEHPVYEMVRAIRGAGRRAATLTRQLLSFSRRTVVSPIVLDLNGLLRDREELLKGVVGEDVALVLQLDPELCAVSADPAQLEQVLMNLALNARDAMPAGGRIRLTTRNLPVPAHDGGAQVLFSFEDDGIGMPEETRARVFEPFFTTKEVGRGSGLGLPVVFGIVQQSGGRIELESEPGQGATFRIYLPRSEGALAARRAAPEAASTPGGSGTVLVVEHEERIRTLACAALESAGYRVLHADGSGSALSLSENLRDRIDLLVTDVVLPELGGRELAGHLRAKRPDLKVLFVSGHTDDVLLRKGIRRAEAHFLPKPFTAAALARKVRDVLASAP